MNFNHKYQLVKAELCFALGKYYKAMEYYDRAIEGAIKQSFTHEEALAKELAGDFYLARGRPRLAHEYLREAYGAYIRWGAVIKLQQLEPKLYQPTTSP